MVEVDMSLMRALKVWWSFIWRTWVLMIPVSFGCFFFVLMVFFLSGGLSKFSSFPPDPGSIIKMGYGLFLLLYVVFVPAMLFVQVFAFKLALKAVWSDFRLVPVAITIIDTPANGPVTSTGIETPHSPR